MAYDGMDVDAVRAAAQQLSLHASQLNGLITNIEVLVSQAFAAWDGPDVHDFQGSWTGQHRPKLQALHQDLVAAATVLKQQAADQDTVSGGAGAAAALTPASMLSFSDAAEHGGRLPSGWTALNDTQLRALGLDPRSIDGSDSTGLNATIYGDGHGHYVLAFAGTKGDVWHPERAENIDWAEDDKSALDGILPINSSQQAQRAADIAYQLKSSVGVQNMEITGHSLGGRDAAVAAVATGATAVTFNAAGPSEGDLVYARELRGEHVNAAQMVASRVPFTGGAAMRIGMDQSNITDYVTSDDPLTVAEIAAAGTGLTRVPLGAVHVVGDGIDLRTGHNLDNFEGKI